MTAVNALGEITVATVISEIGGKEGLDAFLTEKAWCSWLAVAPGNNISGGKNLGGQSKKCKNRIKSALCMAATSLAQNVLSGPIIDEWEHELANPRQSKLLHINLQG